MTPTLPADIKLDTNSFQAIADLAYRESGITLVSEKSSMIQSRLRHRLRELGLQSFAEYCALVQSVIGEGERRHLISALTTNVSHFFRENHHFELLKDHFQKALPDLHAGGMFRIWSAGCSNGQEAVSAAITLLEVAPDAQRFNIRILGTDIDHKVVNFARAGRYPAKLMAGVPPDLCKKYFTVSGTPTGEETYQACRSVQDMIRFNELNLLHKWPMSRRFDIIFCRNVLIYFDLKTQQKIWPGFQRTLAPEGKLFLGHSERIPDPGHFGFESIGPTTYRHLQP